MNNADNAENRADYSDLYLDHIKMVKSKNYKIEITFTTNRDLTPKELSNLEGAITLQINEPMNEDNEDETYETSQITYKMEEVK